MRWAAGPRVLGILQQWGAEDRKFGRKESTRMKTDLTDPPKRFY